MRLYLWLGALRDNWWWAPVAFAITYGLFAIAREAWGYA